MRQLFSRCVSDLVHRKESLCEVLGPTGSCHISGSYQLNRSCRSYQYCRFRRYRRFNRLNGLVVGVVCTQDISKDLEEVIRDRDRVSEDRLENLRQEGCWNPNSWAKEGVREKLKVKA